MVREPLGGAHRDFETTAENIRETVNKALKELKEIPRKELPNLRYEKFRKMGVFSSK